MADRLNGERITKLRRQWAPAVEAGLDCPRCGHPIEPGQVWDLGHQHDLALGGHPAGAMLPEHATCNRSAGARLGNQLRARPRRRLTDWLG